jgi:lysine 2,3-aminomutase
MSITWQEGQDWRWQVKNSIKTIEVLNQKLPHNVEREAWLRDHFKEASLPFSVTPHFVSLMSGEPDCPIFSQVISSAHELIEDEAAMRDPLGEEPRQKVPHLVHRYPDRVLFLATDRCASYCRFCHRKRWVGQGPSPKRDQQEEAFVYIEQNPNIKEIVFSGGDPLLLSNQRLGELIERSFGIKHIEFVRFHSRMLSFAPMRIDEGLVEIFAQYSPIYLVTHFNHPREINDATKKAINMLHSAGIALLNQAVLLKGVNDDETILKDLFLLMAKLKIRPYYLHQCDIVTGSRHFRVPIKRSLELMDNLRGRISGHCLPTLVIDIPGGHGKVPLVKNPIVKEDEQFIYLQGFSGGVAAYPKD